MKATWTAEQWREFGRRLEAVRLEVQRLLCDVSSVASLKDCRALERAERALREAKSRMESVTLRQQPGEWAPHWSYGPHPADPPRTPPSRRPAARRATPVTTPAAQRLP